MTYYYYRASSIEFGQVPLASYTETRLANTEKILEQKDDGRWQNWKSKMANRRILLRATGFGRGGEFELVFVPRYVE